MRQAAANILPLQVDQDRDGRGSGSTQIADWQDETPEYLDFDDTLLTDFGLTFETAARSAALANSAAMFPLLQQSASQAMSADDAEQQARAAKEAEEAMIAEALANPLSYLWLGFIQNDVINYTGDIIDALGEMDVINNTTLIMPVLSIQLTEKWKTVIRPVIPKKPPGSVRRTLFYGLFLRETPRSDRFPGRKPATSGCPPRFAGNQPPNHSPHRIR